jgi:hypothetical protein
MLSTQTQSSRASLVQPVPCDFVLRLRIDLSSTLAYNLMRGRSLCLLLKSNCQKLVIPPENARTTFTRTSIDETQASILSHSLMQNLVVTEEQPKKSAVPVIKRLFASHQRSLEVARVHNEPAGQIAARELELAQIKGALQRAE